jgi:hypothetical protein
MSPLNVIIMREQLNVKQRQAISETPAKDGGGLVETCFCHLAGWSPFRSSDLGSAVAFRAQYSSSATRAVWIISPVKRARVQECHWVVAAIHLSD